MRRAGALIAIGLALAIAPAASAQTEPAPPREAVVHFQEGKKHRDAGRCDLAVPEFEATLRYDPTSIGAHYNLGVCYERIDRRKAFVHYSRAAELAKEKDDDRLREIRAQLADFLDKTSHVRLALPRPWPEGLEVTVDGRAVDESALDTETIVFPPSARASYAVRVTAPGYEETTLTVQRNALATVVLKKKSEPRTARGAEPSSRGGWHWQRWLGLGAMAIGIGGVAYSLASYFSYDARRRSLEDSFNQAVERCRPNCESDPRATQVQRDYDKNESDAKDDAPLWIGAGIAGALAIGGGVFLFLTAPSGGAEAGSGRTTSVRLAPIAGKGRAGLQLVGTF